MNLHDFLDHDYPVDGDSILRDRLSDEDVDINAARGALEETPLHVAARRRRLGACQLLLKHGAKVNATNACGKTAYAHAVRRGFLEIADCLREHDADPSLAPADAFAVAVCAGLLDEARSMLAAQPTLARTGNPEEDRLLADMAGRGNTDVVAFLIEAGADLSAPGLDGGTSLHQAAWFGQPANARMLIDAGAPLDVFDPTHEASPIHWTAHGSRYSGDADKRQADYVEIAQLLLAAGCSLCYPEDPDGRDYIDRMLRDASPAVGEIIREASGM